MIPPPHPQTLEGWVRWASQPDDPRLLLTYLDLCDEQSDWSVYLRAYDVLVAVICDHNLPRHWRCLCLDHVYRALAGLHRLASTAQQRRTLRQCNHEIGVLSHLHLHQLAPPSSSSPTRPVTQSSDRISSPNSQPPSGRP